MPSVRLSERNSCLEQKSQSSDGQIAELTAAVQQYVARACDVESAGEQQAHSNALLSKEVDVLRLDNAR